MNIKFMERAIDLATRGSGYTNPNPLVGAVIVKNNKVIGEGYHKYYGGSHAEINAFNNSTEQVEGATMYVTLEPCSHYGKTPPCVKAIVDKGIRKVVIGMEDPNPVVAGRGIKFLKENDIEVVSEVMVDEVKKLNEIFIKYITTRKPFCILKTAMTLDGKIATITGDSKWITNKNSRKYVHEIRHRVSGIMVGIGTVLKDDPMLTTRFIQTEARNPIRIIVDSKCRIPLDSKVLNINSNSKTIVATTKQADNKKIEKIKERGAEVLVVPMKDRRVDLNSLIGTLGEKGIDSVLIEGGSTLSSSAINEDIVDKYMSFIAPKIIGGKNAKTPVAGKGCSVMKDAIILKDLNIKRFGDDLMIEGYIRKDDYKCLPD
ncbi:bifunctional diaminohydroxyphosphoribosylaminopyrimidine deaminase/5-amino-6-(5-phosphoribosylamino)uracil reductase RibD [Sporosalibacterium faouarense]|uniref:bifunctional diaminohydroxyphosphoribosylaminopyrimidine deaminase/5-amino-6-(5-phosphoribosylamino)uracil reductase RibD n=1 Tax=Sporosalibacterium faouarense TaxID=516123 RepID=UPI00141C29D7|nr:bifunctional diaminohydroxyphosphoribosylaminopyrimidine deaminase/5-amino-6-(5-phosphoribosylamino)uracil reductase RibD [Sporosalibacterium faouarense]MTI48237.1 bifunctional diaminohydroxyphosphoribosylaminopyrimidine deaminase/5-amino-6-(5-phosphoribosylamino)uracil reductase RibD [Bacillota bacterium]